MSRFAFFVAFCLASQTAWADKAGVAVLDIQGTGIEVELLPTLTEVLTVEIDNLGMYKVIGGRDIQAMLGFEKQKDMVGCTDAACLAEIGGALGVDRIVASHIGMVGSTYVVNIKLINIRLADTESRVYETVRGEVDALIATIRKSVGKLLGRGSKAAVAVGVAPPPEPKPAPAPPPESKPEPKKVVAKEPEKRAAASTAPPPPSVEAKDEGGIGWIPVTLWGLGAISVGGGVVFGLAAKKQEELANEKWEDDDRFYAPGAQSAAEKAEQAATLSTVAYGIGGALIAGGVAVWLLSGPDNDATAFVPVVGQDSVGFAFAGAF